MIEQAKKKNKINIAGSLVIKESDEFFNRLIVASPKGQIQYYDKKHLFSYADEHLNYSPGKQELIININGVKIAFFICYDLRFPVWSRNTKLKYDVAVYIANWPEKRKEHWITLLKARAIENQSYVIGVNRIGNDGNGINYSGESAVYNYLGQKISTTKPHEFRVENISINIDDLNNYRIKFPTHLDADEFNMD
jgi:predicted amidohydrolase